MNAKQFQESIYSTIKKYFPNGHVSLSKLALNGGMCITVGLIGDIKDVANSIRANDPLKVMVFIHDDFTFNDESTELDKLVLEFSMSHVSVKPTNKYMYCESKKIPARKINAVPEKALINFEKYIKRVKEAVDTESANNNIIAQDKIPEKYL